MCDRKTRKRKRGEKGVRRTLDETREGGFNFQHSQLLLNEKTANLIRYARKDETMVINQSKWKRKTSSSSSSTAELLLYNSSISVKKRGNKKKKKGTVFHRLTVYALPPTAAHQMTSNYKQLRNARYNNSAAGWWLHHRAHSFLSFFLFYLWSSVRVYLKIGRSFMQL